MKIHYVGYAVATAAVLVTIGTAVAAATPGDPETPITGDALATARAAALAQTGGGTVTETKVGDEDTLYQVEVTLPDSSQVDVQLDENFTVVATKTEAPGTDDGAN